MPIDFTVPTKTQNYDTGVLSSIRSNQLALATLLDGASITGGSAGIKRYNASSTLFEKFDGTAWSEMPLAYLKLAGGTVTGNVTSPDPTSAGHLATKNYVDTGLGTKANTSALESYAALAGASFTGSVGVGGNLSASGTFGAAGAIYGGGGIDAGGTVGAADGTLTTTGQFYLGSSGATTPVINFDSGDYLAYARGSNTLSLYAGGATPLQISPTLLSLTTGISWVSGSTTGSYSTDFRLANTHSGGGPTIRVNPSNGLELVDSGYANVNFTFADAGNLTTRGLLYGRGGGAGLGQITPQSGGSPSGGADGDLFLIY